jgi:hypothetical protein
MYLYNVSNEFEITAGMCVCVRMYRCVCIYNIIIIGQVGHRHINQTQQRFPTSKAVGHHEKRLDMLDTCDCRGSNTNRGAIDNAIVPRYHPGYSGRF